MMLQVHKNGAKFPISKVYVDDEQLDPNQAYTLIIIPEGPRMEGVVLTYFDKKAGPTILGAHPETLVTAEIQETCVHWLDNTNDVGYFSASVGSITGLNYYFEIPNKWMPAGKDTVMLTLLVGNKPGILIEDVVSNTLADQAQQLANDFAMYRDLCGEVEAGKQERDEKEMAGAKDRVLHHLSDVKLAIDVALEIQEKLDSLGSGTKMDNAKRQ